MKDIVRLLQEFNMLSVFVRTVIAMVLGGILGLEREQLKRAAGFRTFVIVCVGSALATMTGIYMQISGMSSEAARMPAQVISGMGFLGAGTILVTKNSKVKGLTTAASLWTVACIGIAVGSGFYSGAIMGTLAIVVALCVLKWIENKLDPGSKECQIYVESTSGSIIRKIIRISKNMGITTYDYELTTVEEDSTKNYSVVFYAKKSKNVDMESFVETICKEDVVIYAEEM